MVPFNVRDFFRALTENGDMLIPEWRRRLLDAIAARRAAGMSYVKMAELAGLKRNYVQQLVKLPQREPGMDHFLKLCEVLEVSPVSIITGLEIDPQIEEFLRLVRQVPPEKVRAALTLWGVPSGTL